ITSLHRQLADDGVELLVLLLPAKARVYEEQLGRYALPAGVGARQQQVVRALAARGVPVLDLEAPLTAAKREAATFLRTDSHWTPFGAAQAAAAVAERLAGRHWLGSERYETVRL